MLTRLHPAGPGLTGRLMLALALSLLAACQAPPRAPSGPPAPAPSRELEPPPAPPSQAAPVAVSAEARSQAQKVSVAAAELLEAGNEDQARNDLKRALALDPQNRLALSLVRQMTVDPIAALGRESFAYTVRAGDSMSRIAGRFMNDVYSFYLLARYNDIKVPRLVSAGQVIRVPGRAPAPGAAAGGPSTAPAFEPARANPSPPTPAVATVPLPAVPTATAPAPAPAPVSPPEPGPGELAMRSAGAAEKAGDLARARGEYLKAAHLNQPGAPAKAEQMRTLLVGRYSTAARTALTRQDLDASIVNWQRVLEVDADNATGRLELDRVRRLKEKLGSVK